MPAEKGIPKPEASARRLDVRNYDLRGAWRWLSEDERLIMSKEGITYIDVVLVCLKFDEFLKEYNLSIHKLTARDFFAGNGTPETTKVDGNSMTLKDWKVDFCFLNIHMRGFHIDFNLR